LWLSCSSACGLVVSLSFSVAFASLDLLDFGAYRFKGVGMGSSPRGSVSKLARPSWPLPFILGLRVLVFLIISSPDP